MANSLLDATFAACAHPIRRGILERLATAEMTVGEASRDFGVSKPAISRHLRILEEAGTIVRVVDGRNHRLRINHESLDEAGAWFTDQRAVWERKFDAVEEFLAASKENDARGKDGRDG